MKEHKELIECLKVLCCEGILNSKYSYMSQYHDYCGMARAFQICGKISKEEQKEFTDWLFDLTTIEYEPYLFSHKKSRRFKG